MAASPGGKSKRVKAGDDDGWSSAGEVLPFVTLDGEMRLIDASPAWFRRFGWRPEEAVGGDWRQFLSPVCRRDFETLFAAAQIGDRRIADAHCVVQTRDGRALETSLSGYAAPAVSGAAPVWRLFLADVGASSLRVRELEAQAAHLRGLLDEIGDLVTVTDVDGRLIFANRAYARLHARSLDEILRSSLWDFVPEAEKPAVAAHFERVGLSRAYLESENTVIAGNGEKRRVAWRNRAAHDEQGRVDRIYSFGQDVEARRAAEAALGETRDRLSVALEAADLSTWEYDVASGRFRLDQRSAEIVGCEPDVAARRLLRRLRREDRRGALEAMRAATSGPSGKFSFQARGTSREGAQRWMRCDGKVAERNARGDVRRIVGAAMDITAAKASETRIHRMAFVDPLTALPNRALFLDCLQRAIAQARGDGRRVAVLLADLDRFKEINDTLGHETGDRVLAEVARRMRDAVREGDLFARLGGDEFAVLALDADEPEALGIARRLAESLRNKVFVGGDAFALGVSVGVAIYPNDGQRPDLLLRSADIAMYRAKASRNGVARYDAAMSSGLAERLALSRDLAEALKRDADGELQLHYQPQVDMRTGALIGAEALLRWRHPTLGPIAPDAFLPMAEERGMMSTLGAWVLRGACRQLADWRAAGLVAPARLAINVAAQELNNRSFFDDTLACVRGFGLTPSMIELELTESGAMENLEDSIETFRRLGEAGFSIALDDFGAGYSSLAQLKRLPVGKLKIDRSFVRDMTDSENGRAITATIVAMGRTLGMETIAEGVETDSQRDALLQLGCIHAQGYRFGRPVPSETFGATWLDAAAASPIPLPVSDSFMAS